MLTFAAFANSNTGGTLSAIPVLIPEAENVEPPAGTLTLSTDGTMRTELGAVIALILNGLVGKPQRVSFIVKQGRTHTRYTGRLTELHDIGASRFAVLDWGMSIDVSEVISITVD